MERTLYIKAYEIKKGDKIDGLTVQTTPKNEGGTIEVIVPGGILYYDFTDDVTVERN
jgi:hypothetical protein